MSSITYLVLRANYFIVQFFLTFVVFSNISVISMKFCWWIHYV